MPGPLDVLVERRGNLGDGCLTLTKKGETESISKISVQSKATFDFDLHVSRSCRTALRVDAPLQLKLVDEKYRAVPEQDISINADIVPLDWWVYWGPIVLTGLAALFALVTLLCIINGWLKPALSLPEKVGPGSIFVALDLASVTKDDASFVPPEDRYGAFTLRTHLRPGGWYRNAELPLGDPRCRVLSPGIRVSLELQPGRGRFRFVRVSEQAKLYRVDPTLVRKPKDALVEEPLGSTPRATLAGEVGFPCRLYARALGRMPAVLSVPINADQWYAIGTGDEPPAYFFKLAASPT